MAKQTFKEKVKATKHLEYDKHDDTIRMRLNKGYDEYGKRIREGAGPIIKRLYMDSKRESDSAFIERASRERSRLQDEVENTVTKEDPTLTLAEFIPTFIELVENDPDEKSDGTSLNYVQLARQITKDKLLASMPIREIEAFHIDDFYTRLKNNTTDASMKPNGATTIGHKHGVLYMIFNHAIKRKIISVNPMNPTGIKNDPNRVVKPTKQGHTKKDPIPPEVLKKLREKSEDDELGAIIRMACFSGMYPSEILFLKWKHIIISDTRSYIQVRGTQHEPKGGGLKDSPFTKRNARQRTITMYPEFKQMMIDHRQHQETVSRYKLTEESNVFCDLYGKPYRNTTAGQHLSKLAKEIGRTDINFVTLRHAVASGLALMGVPPALTKQFMGHDRIETTLNIYADVIPDFSSEVADSLGSYMNMDLSKKFDVMTAKVSQIVSQIDEIGDVKSANS